jgi:hypothetical protein
MNPITTSPLTSTVGVVLGVIPAVVEFSCGFAALAHITIPGVTITGNPSEMLLEGGKFLGIGLLGLFAKDWNRTGGVKQA